MRSTRRAVLHALAATPFLACGARAQADWRGAVPEIRFGVSSAENEATAGARNQPFVDYLSRRLGVPARMYRTTDYAGLVEGMRANQIEFARFGPAVYSLGRRVLGTRLEPLLRDVDNHGSEGYFSVVVVRAADPYRSIQDLRGKTFAFADPNSTSGYAFPSYFLRRQGFDPATHFGATTFSGGHQNSVLALVRGQFDAIATHETNDTSGMVQRLVERGMIPAGSTRVIWRSPLIPNSPFCARGDLPAGLKSAFVEAMHAMASEAPDVWRSFTDGQVSRYAPARHEDYVDVVAVVEELDRERRSRPRG
jgi:phosphonate transport system substrate-binding protein